MRHGDGKTTFIRFTGVKGEKDEVFCIREYQTGNESSAKISAMDASHDDLQEWDWRGSAEPGPVRLKSADFAYNVVNGTFYDFRTSNQVVIALENAKAENLKVRVHLGDTATGRDWLEENDVQGTLGRSSGRVKIPLLIAKNEDGGPGLLDHCIVRIRTVGKNAKDLYKHPLYTFPTPSIKDEIDQQVSKLKAFVYFGDKLHAGFKTRVEAEKWLAKMIG